MPSATTTWIGMRRADPLRRHRGHRSDCVMKGGVLRIGEELTLLSLTRILRGNSSLQPIGLSLQFLCCSQSGLPDGRIAGSFGELPIPSSKLAQLL